MNRGGLVRALLAWAGALATSAAAEAPADRILANARVWTGEAQSPRAEAVALRGGRIVFVGDTAGAAALRGPKTEYLDLAGRLVVPGFNDAHIHLVEGALTLDEVDLIEDQDVAAVQKRIGAFAAANPKSPWVRGRG